MKKLLALLLSLIMLCSMCPVAIATSEVQSPEFQSTESVSPQAETTYWYRIAEIRNSDVRQETFTVNKKLLFSTRKCYMHFAFKFANDTTTKSVIVSIGDLLYSIPADGEVHSYTESLPAGRVLTVSTLGITSDCACIISVLSID